MRFGGIAAGTKRFREIREKSIRTRFHERTVEALALCSSRSTHFRFRASLLAVSLCSPDVQLTRGAASQFTYLRFFRSVREDRLPRLASQDERPS